MILRNLARGAWLPALVGLVCLASPAIAQTYRTPPQPGTTPYGGYRAPGQPQAQPPQQPAYGPARSPYHVAERSNPTGDHAQRPMGPPQPQEHPLMPAIRWARNGAEQIRQVQDYSAVMVKRERIGGKVGEEQYMFVKIRHRPLSVYMCFLKPESLQGQEAIYVDGQNNGKLLGHPAGLKNKLIGTVSLTPTGVIAMQGNRYPITEIGLLNLVERLIDVAEKDAQFGECDVKFIPGAKINGRTCTCIQVMHPVPRRNFLFHLARIFVDDELNLPIRYEAYDWPREPGGQPELIEQYTYLNIALNNGFTDADFDVRNPNYQFGVK